MWIPFMMFMCIFSLKAYTAQSPQFIVCKNVLKESEIIHLQSLTENVQPKLLWYGRYNFWKESFEACLNDIGQSFIFTHFNEHNCNHITNKLSNLLLTKVQEFGLDIINKRIILESYLDRNIVDLKNASSSGMFWHRDSIIVDGQKRVADFTLILLINGKTQNWEGGEVVLQL